MLYIYQQMGGSHRPVSHSVTQSLSRLKQFTSQPLFKTAEYRRRDLFWSEAASGVKNRGGTSKPGRVQNEQEETRHLKLLSLFTALLSVAVTSRLVSRLGSIRE